MSGEQLRGWLAFAAVEPFGDAQADLRAGVLARTTAEPNRDTAKHPEPFTPFEFVPWLVTTERAAELDMTDEERAAEAREGRHQARIRALRLAGLDEEGRLLVAHGDDGGDDAPLDGGWEPVTAIVSSSEGAV